MNQDYLAHHGVKGMKWGVRRYQNYDGSLTSLGLYRRRAMNASKTKSQVDEIYNSLSKHEKHLLGDDKNLKEFLSIEEGEYVVKRFIDKEGDIPVAFLDIMTTTKPGHLTVALATKPEYREQGRALKLATKGKEWFDKNADKIDATYLEWGAYTENKPSRQVAEKVGFKYEKKKSDDEWAVYGYKKKK